MERIRESLYIKNLGPVKEVILEDITPMTVLIGKQGCGKSTFMRFLVSLDTPDKGEIIYRGIDITKLKGEKLRQNRQIKMLHS